MIVLRACALGDLVVTGPLLARLPAPFLVAHAEHVALARAAGWVDAGFDAELAGLHALYADAPDPSHVAPALRERLVSREPVLVLGRPGALRAALMRGLAAAGAHEVSAHDPLPPPGVHAADHLATAAGRLMSPAISRIDLPEPLRARGREHLRALDLNPAAPVIALHPGAGSAAKCWPAAAWVATWQELGAVGQPVIICGPADARPAKQLADRLGAPLLRDLPLVELAAALADCHAVLGHDSGISHLAAALGVRTLALFGPTDPAQWAPRGRCVRIVRAPNAGLERLSPADVIEAARALTAAAQTSSR